MAVGKKRDRDGTPEAEPGDVGRERPAGRLVDFDPWGALFGAMWDGPTGGDAPPDRLDGSRETTDGRAKRARSAKAGRSPRRGA